MASFAPPQAGGDAESTSGEITLAVSTTGVDREGFVLTGDLSSTPYLSIQSAIDAIPKYLAHDVTIVVGAGTFDGFVAKGFVGGGNLRIAGTFSAATITTGVTSGTAGAGTSSTSLVKPAAAANWTANDLRGKYVVISSGGGASTDANFPTVRPIKSNTTGAITVDEIYGLDNTSVFLIANVATVVGEAAEAYLDIPVCAGFFNSQAGIYLQGIAPTDNSVYYGVLAFNCGFVDLAGITVTPTGYQGISAINCDYLSLDACYGTAPIEALHCGRVETNYVVLGNTTANAGMLDISTCRYVQAVVDAAACSSNAVRIRHCTRVTLTSVTASCTATPVRLENLHYATIASTGANAGTTYGMSLSGGGQYIVTGSTVAGTSDVLVEATAVSWATLALGTYGERGTFVYWGTGGTRWAGEVLALGGITNGGIQKEYGYQLVLDNGTADSALLTSVTAYAGGGQANAVNVGLQLTKVATVASAADSIKLREVAAGGAVGYIHNLGANACNLYPPSGGAINALGTNNPISIPAGSAAMWFSLTTVNYAVRVF